MIEDYAERLFAHFVAGRWRVPFSTRPGPVCDATGQLIGQIVAAEDADIARARAALRGADDAACARLAEAVLRASDPLAQACEIQTGTRPEPHMLRALAAAIARPQPGAAGVFRSGDGLAPLGRALGRGVRGGMIWCPPPAQAVFATALAQVIQQADLPAGAFNLLHADLPQTRAALDRAKLPALA